MTHEYAPPSARYVLIALAVVAGAGLTGACGTIDRVASRDDVEGGTRTRDAGFGAIDDAGNESEAPEGLGVDTSAGTPPGRGGCYTEAGQATCDVPGCTELRACCVGDGTCCAPIENTPLPSTLPFEACVGGGDVASCLVAQGVAATRFGAQPPRLEAGGYFSAGDSATEDSGLVIGAPVDLRTHGVRIGTTFTDSTSCDVGCVESAAVALVATATDSGEAVRPIAGLLYAGGPDRVSLLVADEVIQSWPHSEPEERWELLARPDGWVTAIREGELLIEQRYEPPSTAHLTVFGRSSNPGAGEASARLSNVTTTVALCDIPTAWDAPEPVRVVVGSVDLASAVEEPSVLVEGDETLLAFRADQTLYLARAVDGAFQASAIIEPSMLDGFDWAKAGVRDPELVREDGSLVVYFTGRGIDGEGTIGRADLPSAAGLATGLAPVIVPADHELASLEAPTVQAHASGGLVLIARAIDADAHVRLRIFRRSASSFDSRDWRAQAPWHLEALTAGEDRPVFDYAADAIGDPTLTVHGRMWKVFLTGRRGNRWSATLYASDDLVEWRVVQPEPVLAASGAAIDSLGVRSADIASVGDRIEVFYRAAGNTGTLLRRRIDATDAGVPDGF
jgi:hypothetical protein